MLLNYLDEWKIDNTNFSSRLLVGTGKFQNPLQANKAIELSEASLITVAIRRLSYWQENPKSFWIFLKEVNKTRRKLLPNTAGSKTADEAIRLAFLGKEILNDIGQQKNYFLKLEVIADPIYLMPDTIGTLKAADYLIKQGFRILPYINNDPSLALHLEELGCSTIMPLGSAIGSNQGIKSLENLKIIIENASIPIIVDAGLGNPSDTSKAMEMGADAVLVNSAIANSNKPEIMAQAMKLGVRAGRLAYIAQKEKQLIKSANASSPTLGGL